MRQSEPEVKTQYETTSRLDLLKPLFLLEMKAPQLEEFLRLSSPGLVLSSGGLDRLTPPLLTDIPHSLYQTFGFLRATSGVR